jgi:hypothetical protein
MATCLVQLFILALDALLLKEKTVEVCDATMLTERFLVGPKKIS